MSDNVEMYQEEPVGEGTDDEHDVSDDDADDDADECGESSAADVYRQDEKYGVKQNETATGEIQFVCKYSKELVMTRFLKNVCNRSFRSLEALTNHQVFDHRAFYFCDGCCSNAFSEKLPPKKKKAKRKPTSRTLPDFNCQHRGWMIHRRKKRKILTPEFADLPPPLQKLPKVRKEGKKGRGNRHAPMPLDKIINMRRTMCGLCGEIAKCIEDLLSHVKEKHPHEAFICDQCDIMICWNKHRLDVHKAIIHRPAGTSVDDALKSIGRIESCEAPAGASAGSTPLFLPALSIYLFSVYSFSGQQSKRKKGKTKNEKHGQKDQGQKLKRKLNPSDEPTQSSQSMPAGMSSWREVMVNNFSSDKNGSFGQASSISTCAEQNQPSAKKELDLATFRAEKRKVRKAVKKMRRVEKNANRIPVGDGPHRQNLNPEHFTEDMPLNIPHAWRKTIATYNKGTASTIPVPGATNSTGGVGGPVRGRAGMMMPNPGGLHSMTSGQQGYMNMGQGTSMSTSGYETLMSGQGFPTSSGQGLPVSNQGMSISGDGMSMPRYGMSMSGQGMSMPGQGMSMSGQGTYMGQQYNQYGDHGSYGFDQPTPSYGYTGYGSVGFSGNNMQTYPADGDRHRLRGSSNFAYGERRENDRHMHWQRR